MFRRFCLISCLAVFSAPAFAAGASMQQSSQPDWMVSLGAGVAVAPAFLGSDDYNLMLFPDLRVRYKDQFFMSAQEGTGYNAIRMNGWRAGPILRIRFRRDEEDGNPFRIAGRRTNALRGLGDVDTAYEIGGFAEYAWQNYSSKVELRQGFDGHDGMIMDINANYNGQYQNVRYSVGPRLTWASENHNNMYYGINSAQSSRSGLSQYKADGGIVSAGVGAAAQMPLTDAVTASAFIGYDNLGEEIADSPLVNERGSEDQFSGGMGISYAFGL